MLFVLNKKNKSFNQIIDNQNLFENESVKILFYFDLYTSYQVNDL